jgi:hypothetical protein
MVFIPIKQYLFSILLEQQAKMPELMIFELIGWFFGHNSAY